MSQKREYSGRRRKKKNVLLPFIIIIALTAGIYKAPDAAKKYVYPKEYSCYVEEYSARFGMDKNFVYAVIKTESNFDASAESDAGARGLMQLMEDAYDWVGYRMEDSREITYDQMFDPEYNIEYGTYLLMLLYEEYGDKETVLAAYHSGRGNVNSWLAQKDLSADGKKLDDIPSSATKHYVNKVMNAYAAYNNLYN